LATILSLIRQSLKNNHINKTNYQINVKILKNLEKDLMFLQKNYEVIKKDNLL